MRPPSRRGQGLLRTGLVVCAAAVACWSPTRTVLAPNAFTARVVEAGPIEALLGTVVRNDTRDTLSINTTCGGTLGLEYRNGRRWRPVIHGVSLRECLAIYTEVRVPPGDSALVGSLVSGKREGRVGAQWAAPLTGEYRYVQMASGCLKRGHRGCWHRLVSPPFRLAPPSSDR